MAAVSVLLHDFTFKSCQNFGQIKFKYMQFIER